MYSILFSILLASTYVSAIPMPLGVVIDPLPLEPVEKERHEDFKISLKEANRRINNMQEVIKDPKDYRVTKAFGPNANRREITKVLKKLKDESIRVDSMDPTIADDRGPRFRNGFTQLDNVGNPIVYFGSTFFSNDKEHQAGTIIHEATHALAKTGDNLDTTNGKIIAMGETAPDGAEVKERGGYADGLTPSGDVSGEYRDMTKAVSNTYQNADSYRAFAAMCPLSRKEVSDSFAVHHKRGLGKDDQGSKCNPPPYYLEKKAAAARGTTPAANKGRTSTAVANGKASIVKSTGIRAAKGASAVRKGKYPRKATGAKAGKGLKAVKGTKAVKGLRTAKGARTAKGCKTPRPGKDLKAVKGGKDIKGVKAAKGVKKFKSSGTGKGVKVAKGIKAAKGAQRTKGKSIKAVKATTSPKPTAPGKSASDANAISRAFAKATSHAAVKAAVPKAAVKVSAAIPNKRTTLRRDVGIIFDELE